MKHPLISVIMPAYNVAPYIKRSLESVLKQNYTDLEIIIVDDGSTDETGSICDDYSARDSRIKVIHQINGGLSDARNKGLEISSGDWIHFLDSDDWIEPDMYETLIKLALDNDADLVSCMSRNCYEDGTVDKTDLSGNIDYLTADDLIRGLLTQKKVRFEVWNKLWRRDLIGDARFKVRQVCEDVRFDRLVFSKVNKCVHINKVLHNYLKARKGSTIDGFKVGKMCIFDEFEEWRNTLNKEKKPQLEEIVTCVENTFAQRLYIMALKTKQSNKILSDLKSIYNSTFKHICKSRYVDKKTKLLFRLSPSLYIKLLNLRKNLS